MIFSFEIFFANGDPFVLENSRTKKKIAFVKMGNNTSCGQGTRLNGNICVPTEIVTCDQGTVRESRPDGVYCVPIPPVPAADTPVPALSCGPGTTVVNNECIVQFGEPLIIEQPHVCGFNTGHWQGNTVDLTSYNSIPSSVQVSIGGFDCTAATRLQNLCLAHPSNPQCL